MTLSYPCVDVKKLKNTIINANTGVAIYLDPTVTTEFFGFMKLISGLGGGLSAIGLIKQRTQPSVSEESDDETLG